MPASPCYMYTDPEGRAAWLELEAAAGQLEKMLRNADDHIARINGHGYYLDADNRLMCAPLLLDGTLEIESAFHREDYEGMSASELQDDARDIQKWFLANSPDVARNGDFTGQVLSVEEGFVTQKINRDGSTVRHDVQALSKPVVVGDVVEIKYSAAGVGVVGGEGAVRGLGR